MLPASRTIYEQVDLKTLSQKEFSEVIYRADELIMKPFSRYRKGLPGDIQAKIYNDLHRPIAQFIVVVKKTFRYLTVFFYNRTRVYAALPYFETLLWKAV